MGKERVPITCCVRCLPDAPGKVNAAVRFLGDHADIYFNAVDGQLGWSPLCHMVNIAHTNPEEAEPLIAYLINKGANPDLVDNSGKTPLDHAIELGQEQLVNQLIHLGAGRTLDVQAARVFFSSRPHLEETFTLLKDHSTLLSWHLALDALGNSDCPGTNVTLEGAQLGKIMLPVALTQELLNEQGDIRPQEVYGRRNVRRLFFPGDMSFSSNNIQKCRGSNTPSTHSLSY